MTVKVLFVDDEPNVLLGLRRMLHGMRREWDMRFVESGEAALAALEQSPADVVVSDMRMPGMDGAALLDEVHRRYPDTVRVILSGHSDTDYVLRTVGPAHQYLAKPCGQDALVSVVRRAIAHRPRLMSPRLRGLLTALRHLPTPPDIYFQLIELLNSPSSSPAQVADVISRDVAMTAEILKLTNSAYFALLRDVTSPLQAVRVLGFETLRTLVLRTGICRHFQGNRELARILDQLNAHSQSIARLARTLANLERLGAPGPEQTLCAGMLGDIGTLVLFDQLPAEFHRVRRLLDGGASIIDAEREVFGASHAELGAYLLGLWGFCDTVVGAVAYHLAPSAGLSRDPGPLTMLHAAVALGPESPVHGPVSGRSLIPLDEAYLADVGCLDKIAAWRTAAAGRPAE